MDKKGQKPQTNWTGILLTDLVLLVCKQVDHHYTKLAKKKKKKGPLKENKKVNIERSFIDHPSWVFSTGERTDPCSYKSNMLSNLQSHNPHYLPSFMEGNKG